MNSVHNQHINDNIGVKLSNSSRQQIISRKNTILRELEIRVEDFTEEEINLYAKQIGIDPKSEPELLWIAKRGLISNLPYPWIPVEDQNKRIYYFNCQTDESSWEHPSDQFYRSLAEQERHRQSSATLSMSGLTSIANLHFVDEEMLNNGDSNRNDLDKKSNKIETKLNKQTQDWLKKNHESEEEVESVDFELEVEEAVEEISSNDGNDEELVTIDVTEGGNYDRKQFKEFHTIGLNSVSNSDKAENDRENNRDNKSKSDGFKSKDVLEQKMKMQNSSSSAEHRLSRNTKHSSVEQKVRNNEVSDDEFLLDLKADPFADFDESDQNFNYLFTANTPTKSHVSDVSKQANSIKSLSSYPTVSKPLETLEETSEKDENGLESNRDHRLSISNELEDEIHEEEGDGVERSSNRDEDEDNENGNHIYEANHVKNAIQIEYRFEELTNTLNEKITSLRNELRQELRKQRNAIDKEIKEQMSDLDDKVNKNKMDLKITNTEIQDLKINSTKNSNQTTGDVFNKTDIEKIGRDIQLLRSDVREETMQSIRELRNEVNRDIKSKVNTEIRDFENKFLEFKDEIHDEIRHFRSEISNVNNSCKTIGHQTSLLRDDLSQTLLDIGKQGKEQSKHLEKMGINLDEETKKFEIEVERVLSLMKKQENRVQELDLKNSEIQSLLAKESETNFSDCYQRIDSLNKQVEQLIQQVMDIFSIIDSNKKEVKEFENKIVGNEPNHLNNDTQVKPQTEDLQQSNIYNKMSYLEESVKKISDTFQQMIPIIRSTAQNRYRNRKTNKQNMNKSKANLIEHSNEDDYMSKTSSSLLSSSSISQLRHKSQRGNIGKRQMYERDHQKLKSRFRNIETHSSLSHHCCIHNDREYYEPKLNRHLIKVPLITGPDWQTQHSQFKHIRSTSDSLLNLIKKTTKKLKDEALQLESLGNYRFVSDFNASLLRDDNDCDETAIKNLKSVRVDVDQKLRKLTNTINQQKSSLI